MAENQSIKRFIVRDPHGNVEHEDGFSVVGEVHVNIVSGYGEPYAESEYIDGTLTITIHNIDGNGITDITTDSQEGDEAVNTVTIKTNANPEGVTLEVRNGSRGNGIASSSEVLSPDDGGINTHTITDTDGNEHVFHTKNGSKGDKGDQGDSAVYDPSSPDTPDFVMANTTGQSTTKAMTQKAVTENINDINLSLDGIVDLLPQMDVGTRSTTVGSAVGSLSYFDNFKSIYITKLKVGTIFHVKGMRGVSGGLYAKVSNGIVTEVGGATSPARVVETHDITVDNTFDAIVFNFEINNAHELKLIGDTSINERLDKLGDYSNMLDSLEPNQIMSDYFYHNTNNDYVQVEGWYIYLYNVSAGKKYSISGCTGISGASVIWLDSSGSVIGKDKYNTSSVANFTNKEVIAPSSAVMMGVSGRKKWATGSNPWSYPKANAIMESAVEDLNVNKNHVDNLRVAATESLKILCIGNSFSQDSFCYMPYILKGLAPNIKLTIGIAYYGGANLQDHIGFFNNDSASYSYQKYFDGNPSWQTIASQKPSDIIANQKWDIIVMQQQSSKSGDYSTYQPYLADLINKILTMISKPVKFMWNLTHSAESDLDESVSYFNDILGAVSEMLDETPIQSVNPYGTAIQNARTTSLQQLGEGGNLTQDGTHLQEGIPSLIANYTTILTIAKELGININILGETGGASINDAWVTAHGIPGTNGSCVGISASNCRLAQICAVMAAIHPYSVTDCSSYN